MNDSPTSSEFATFKVLSNPEFTDFNRPLSPGPGPMSPHAEKSEEELDEEEGEIPFSAQKEDEEEYYEEEEEEEEKKVPMHPGLKPVEEPTFLPPQQPFSNPIPKLRRTLDLEEEQKFELDGLLSELADLERSGAVKLPPNFRQNATLEEAQFLRDRGMDSLNADQMVEAVKTGIRLGSGIVESGLKTIGISAVDGYSAELTKDMTKFNFPLKRLYKKYWRSGSFSVEFEVALLFLGPLVWTIVGNSFKPKASVAAPIQPVESLRMPPSPSPRRMDIPGPTWNSSPSSPDNSKINEMQELARTLKVREEELRRKEELLMRRESASASYESLQHDTPPEQSSRTVVLESRKTPGGNKKPSLVL